MFVEYIVMIVGVGGTGGNFAKEFARYADYFHSPDKAIKIVLIDGDKVEEKNGERQPFLAEDVQEYKSVILGEAIEENFPKVDVVSYAKYIDTAEDLEEIFNQERNISCYSELDMSVPILVGCVDNHRARQCMHEFFKNNGNIFYYDSANEYTVGECVMAARIKGKDVAPDRAYYFPDVLTDTSPSVSELSCGAVNDSSPQHLATNLLAADILLSGVVNVVSENEFTGGIVYFDREKYYSKFYSYEEMKKQLEVKNYAE